MPELPVISGPKTVRVLKRLGFAQEKILLNIQLKNSDELLTALTGAGITA